MIAFTIFCIQILFIQHAFSQTVATPAAINNALPNAFGPNIPGIAHQTIPGPNIATTGPGLPGPMLPGPMPGFGPMGPQPLGPNQPMGLMGTPANIAGNPYEGYAANYGGSGSGDVAVAGELPVVGTAAITGHVPMAGKVQFTGTVTAGGLVTISGQCSCGCNGVYNSPYNAKSTYNNKPYLY